MTKKEKISLIILFIISLIIRLTFNLIFNFNLELSRDSDGYEQYAINLLKGKVLLEEWGYYALPPLYPRFLAFIFLIFGHSYLWVIIIQGLIDSSISLLVYFIVKTLIKDSLWAMIAGLFSCFYLGLIVMSLGLSTECLFTFLISLSILFLLKMETTPNFLNKMFSGITLGLATLTRPFVIIFPGFIFSWLFLKYRSFKQTMGIFSLFFLFFILILSPWTIRNYIIYRSFAPVTIHAGATFWASNNPLAKGEWVRIERLKWNPRYNNLSPVEKDRAFFKEGLNFLKKQTFLENIRLVFLKIWWFLFPLLPALYTYDITFIIIFPFCLFGMWMMRKTNSILYYIMANTLLMVVLFHGQPRFRSPIAPFIISFGIIGIYNCREKLKKYYSFNLLIISWILLNFIIFILDTVFDFKFLP